MVHLKKTFNKTTKMARLFSMMRVEAKGLAEPIDETICMNSEMFKTRIWKPKWFPI